ncbi:MAG: class I SAM-dependent methyltransferase [bacterium]
MKKLGLQKNHTVADFGSGTGAFAIHASQQCAKVFAIDISLVMLDYTKWKAQKQGINNIVFSHGGFLTYNHKDAPLDAISTSMALHHLPDFWKQEALRRLHGMLKDGGRLFLQDVVFSEKNYNNNIPAWIDILTKKAGSDMREDVSRHVRQEYSTFTWIMEGLLVRAGFSIEEKIFQDGVLGKYLCTKITS